MKTRVKRLVIVSNRLPVVVQKRGRSWRITPGSGGLVTAMAPVLRDRGGLWIGWAGTPDKAAIKEPMAEASRRAGYELVSVPLTAKDEKLYYRGFSNEVIWPLFHDLIAPCHFAPDYWKAYQAVNRKFADVILKNTRRDDFIWIHDYHLMRVATELRARRMKGRLAFFQHIPFPPLDFYNKLPWRSQLLLSLLDYDFVGFQTERDHTNFLQCVRRIVPGASVLQKGAVQTVRCRGRETRLGTFPISIDFKQFADLSESKEVRERALSIHKDLPKRQLILGLDRLDYTKGIAHRLRGLRNALRRYPELRGKVTTVQIVVPSRDTIAEYKDLKTEIEQLVGEINGEFTRPGWVPVHHMFRSVSQTDLLAYYRTSEIMLVTSLKDGMNLVAKEYCAASTDNNGVLILSEFAGAAEQLGRNALLVNPHDVEGIADALHAAFKMPKDERRRRMSRLRQLIKKADIFSWVDDYLQAAIAGTLEGFPVIEDVPGDSE